MSQSDYIKNKRVGTVLQQFNANPANDPAVLESQDYVNYKEYSLVNSVVNTKPIFSELTQTNYTVVFDMEKAVSTCPTFPICKNTNTRANRMPLSTVYFDPVPQPLSIKAMKNAANLKTACKCILNSKYTDKNKINKEINVCKCKIGRWGIVR
jgi:hypothetical protein